MFKKVMIDSMKVHQNSVFANSFYTNLLFKDIGFFLIGEHVNNIIGVNFCALL